MTDNMLMRRDVILPLLSALCAQPVLAASQRPSAATTAKQPDVVIMSREPHAASPWLQSTEAKCGKSALRISGYAVRKPGDLRANILVNGRRLTGKDVGKLIADLSHRSAVYRLQILCGYQGEITIRIGMGEKQMNGTVDYWSSAAFIRGGTLQSYTGFEAADADSFWFR